MSNQISEEAPAKEKEAPAAAEGGVEQGSEKKIRQAVYDIRYRARREELDLRHAFSQYLGNSNLNQQEKTAVQEKLFGKEGGGGAPAEQAESLAIDSITNALNIVFNETASDQKYKVRVKDKEKPAYVRYADRAKINQLRSNPQISSVEMTGHGDPYEGDKDKKASTSSIKQKGKKDEVSGKDNKIDLKKEEVTNEALQAIPMVAGKVALAGAKVAGKAAVGGAKLAGKAAVGGARLAGRAAAKTAKVAGKTAVKVGKKVGKVAVKQAKSTAMGTANNAYKVGKAVVNRSGRAAKGAIKGALSNEEYLADGNITAPPTNKKITGEKVDNSKLIKVFPQDGSDPQIGNIKSSYKPVGQVVSEILAKEDMNKGYVVTAADKKGNTPAWQGYKAGKKKKDGSPLYKPADHLKNEGVEVKIEGDDDTPATVDALTDVINSKNNDDSRAMYTKWNLAKNKLRAAGLKCGHEPEGEMTEGVLGAASGAVLGGALTGGPIGALAGGALGSKVDVLGGKKKKSKRRLKKEGYTNVVEDIADILARLEKKRISKGGNPDESPLGKKTGRAMKSQQDKARKKAGLKTEHHQKDADGNEVQHEEVLGKKN